MNACLGAASATAQSDHVHRRTAKTTANILARKAFTVSMATAEQMVACDYVGIVSGNDTADKMEKAGWHTTKAEHVDAPLIDELPMALECRLVSYDPENGHMVGQIVNISVDEDVLDGEGKSTELQPITFDPVHNTYRKLGGRPGLPG